MRQCHTENYYKNQKLYDNLPCYESTRNKLNKKMNIGGQNLIKMKMLSTQSP